jgi:predicted HD superfamily hydrolase involved in NAD metabolism
VSQLSVNKIEEAVYKKYANSRRLTHILGVAKLAKELAIKYGLDSEKAYIAGLLHDYCKFESDEDLKSIIADETIIKKFENAPQIYHAYAASVVAKEKFFITDEEILNGIRYHVYGRLGMSLFEKIIVLSDYCEDSRSFERCIEVRRILDEGNFDLALYLCIKYTIEFVISKGGTPLEEQYEILKELEKKL